MWFDSLNDQDILLALCIREEELDDPVAWCRDFRAFNHETQEGPKTVAEAESITARGAELIGRIRKKRTPSEG